MVVSHQADERIAGQGGARGIAREIFTGAEFKSGVLYCQRNEMIFKGFFVLHVAFGAADTHFEQRRLGDINVTTLNQLGHLPEEKGEQQRPDMRAIDVGVRHDDDPVIPDFVGIELIPADAATQRCDQRAHLRRGKHLVEAGLFDIQNLAFQRQDGLGAPGATLLGGTASRVALN